MIINSRKIKKTFFYPLCLAAFLLFLSACGDKAALDSNGIPRTLIIGMYGGDNPGQTKAAMEPLKGYLEKKLGIEVQFIFTTDYTTVIEALRSKKIHAAELTPFAYILATQKPGLIPVATLGIDNKPSLYHSIIFTNPKTGIKTIADLKARAKSLTLCFADPASTSGHLIPRAYLNSIGLNPDSAFKETVFAGSHAASILSVKSGKVDIGCSTSDLALDKLIRDGVVKSSDLVILWTSPPIVNHAITVRDDLNKDLVTKLQNAYLSLSTDDPSVFNGFVRLYYPDSKNMSFVTVQDSQYNQLRKIAGDIKSLKLNK
jgi:phosphonate transport system substrate-binding protein